MCTSFMLNNVLEDKQIQIYIYVTKYLYDAYVAWKNV